MIKASDPYSKLLEYRAPLSSIIHRVMHLLFEFKEIFMHSDNISTAVSSISGQSSAATVAGDQSASTPNCVLNTDNRVRQQESTTAGSLKLHEFKAADSPSEISPNDAKEYLNLLQTREKNAASSSVDVNSLITPGFGILLLVPDGLDANSKHVKYVIAELKKMSGGAANFLVVNNQTPLVEGLIEHALVVIVFAEFQDKICYASSLYSKVYSKCLLPISISKTPPEDISASCQTANQTNLSQLSFLRLEQYPNSSDKHYKYEPNKIKNFLIRSLKEPAHPDQKISPLVRYQTDLLIKELNTYATKNKK